MSKYIPFTTEQKERAASVDLEEFLRRRGEKLITSGRDKRLASDHSITIRGCEWFDHATEQGGRAISFVKQFYGLSYPDAMSLLLGDDLGGDDTLFVFEAPIDLLSYISLFPEGWQEHNYVACCGTSSIPVLEMLRQLPQLRRVYLCLDNDAAGHAASERMAKLLEERGISAERLVPQQKDWNDDLKAEQENKMERSALCQTFC